MMCTLCEYRDLQQYKNEANTKKRNIAYVKACKEIQQCAAVITKLGTDNKRATLKSSSDPSSDPEALIL